MKRKEKIENREAIEIIKTAIAEVEWEYPMDYAVAFENAVQALKKQIPMEVTDVHVDEYYCPACGAENCCNDGIVRDDYCPNCGQALR